MPVTVAVVPSALAPKSDKVLMHLGNVLRTPIITPMRRSLTLLSKKTEKKRKLSQIQAPPLTERLQVEQAVITPMTTLLVDDRLRQHAHPERRHSECPERIGQTLTHLEQCGLVSRCEVTACEEPNEEELCAVHSPFYIQRLRALRGASRERLIEEAMQYDSLYMNEHSVQCALLAAGGVLKIARQIWSGTSRNGMALVRPAGHHANAHTPSGFCLVNSIAVTARQLVREGCERVMIIDWDIHHGDGTQKIFIDDPRVLVVSLHRQDHTTFPFNNSTGEPSVVGSGKGAGFNVNIVWGEPDMGDAEYAYAFRHIVLPLVTNWEPQMILVSAGFDAVRGDPLGDCCVTAAGFAMMTRSLMPHANGKLLLALEGGYSLDEVSLCTAACVRVLLGDGSTDYEAAALERSRQCSVAGRADVERCIQAHSVYWPDLTSSTLT